MLTYCRVRCAFESLFALHRSTRAFFNGLLVCEAHHERQNHVESRDIPLIEATQLPADSLASNRDWLVGHHL